MHSGRFKKLRAFAQRTLRWKEASPVVRKIVIAILGGSVLLVGVAMIFLPGPAFVVVPLGLAILATEFAWARNYLLKARDLFNRARAHRRQKQRQRRHAAAPAR